MTLRSKLATGVGRLTRWALTTFTSGGSSLPGKLALAPRSKSSGRVGKEL